MLQYHLTVIRNVGYLITIPRLQQGLDFKNEIQQVPNTMNRTQREKDILLWTNSHRNRLHEEIPRREYTWYRIGESTREQM